MASVVVPPSCSSMLAAAVSSPRYPGGWRCGHPCCGRAPGMEHGPRPAVGGHRRCFRRGLSTLVLIVDFRDFGAAVMLALEALGTRGEDRAAVSPGSCACHTGWLLGRLPAGASPSISCLQTRSCPLHPARLRSRGSGLAVRLKAVKSAGLFEEPVSRLPASLRPLPRLSLLSLACV